ncbi:MAG: hypothetical protein JSU67_01950 [Gammaproteobacteria bacterium]|nr:MAG: hypothetical protein JSU67_01950 [Gammaproteobacteria bacterium]
MAKGHLSGKLAVILHADVAGSTHMVQVDEHLAHEGIQNTFQRFSETIKEYSGHVLELRGDALLAEFERPSDAVSASLAFQSNQSEFLSSLDDQFKPEVRVGIAMGEVVVANNTITGPGVVMAQRVEQLADPGGLCITAAVRESLTGRTPIEIEDLGEQVLKGFDEPARIFKVGLHADETVPLPRPKRKVELPWRNLGVLAFLVLAIAAGFMYLVNKSERLEKPASINPESAPVIEKPKIAVLPFLNMSEDRDQEYFSDGMTEDLITDLSKISGLTVISRSVTFAYREKSRDIQSIARELKASHIIEGSVRKSGERVRINTQLTDASTGTHLWADRYDRDLEDIFAIQDDVLGKIVSALAVELTDTEERHLSRKGTDSTEAYDLFIHGRHQEQSFSLEGNMEAISYYRQAIAIDPDYAQAYARMANMFDINVRIGWSNDPQQDTNKAIELAKKSIALDAKNPFAYWTQGRIFSRVRSGGIKNQFKAVEALERAIELDPNYADAYGYISYLYVGIGKIEEALSAIETAINLNPQYPFWYIQNRAVVRYMQEDYEAAITDLERASERSPTVLFVRWWLAAAYAQAGRQDDADWQLEEMMELGFHSTVKELLETSVIHHPPYVERFAAGLRKAGIPES